MRRITLASVAPVYMYSAMSSFISISTRDLRVILQEAKGKDRGRPLMCRRIVGAIFREYSISSALTIPSSGHMGLTRLKISNSRLPTLVICYVFAISVPA